MVDETVALMFLKMYGLVCIDKKKHIDILFKSNKSITDSLQLLNRDTFILLERITSDPACSSPYALTLNICKNAKFSSF